MISGTEDSDAERSVRKDRRAYSRLQRKLIRNKTICRRYGEESKADRMTFYKGVYIYMLGGLVGTLWETILFYCKGWGFIYCNGSIFTPFNMVYGCGAVFIICALKNREKWWQVFAIGTVGSGIIEYTMSFLEETLLGTRSWDYSTYPLNINGRTNIPYMLFFGVLCVFVVFVVYKPLNRLLEKIPKKVLKTVAVIMFVILVIDLIFVALAVLRYSGRNSGIEAMTWIGRFFDTYFDDAYMKLHFPKMNFSS